MATYSFFGYRHARRSVGKYDLGNISVRLIRWKYISKEKIRYYIYRKDICSDRWLITSGYAGKSHRITISVASHGREALSNHQQLDCFFNSLFKLTANESNKNLHYWCCVREPVQQPMDSPQNGPVMQKPFLYAGIIWIFKTIVIKTNMSSS